MSTSTLRDATRKLHSHFSSIQASSALSPDCRRLLQDVVSAHEGRFKEEETIRVNEELKTIWDKYVADRPERSPPFVSALRDLGPALGEGENVSHWYKIAIRPVITGVSSKKAVLSEAQEFLVPALKQVVKVVEDIDDEAAPSDVALLVQKDLMEIYLANTSPVVNSDTYVAADGLQIAQQAESILLAIGRDRPADLFFTISDFAYRPDCRLRALVMLGAFVRSEAPRLHQSIDTPLLDTLLLILMNDVSTPILSVALQCLIMLLPYIPMSVFTFLPRLFLVYSRLLCWERYDPRRTPAERNSVTDPRFYLQDDEEDWDGIGIEPNWKRADSSPEGFENVSPDLSAYFTFLYATYPLNFMSFIYKPRKFLKRFQFPQADEFDLDREVIHARSERFRKMHLLHPHFYNMAVENEVDNPNWLKYEPSDIVADCREFSIDARRHSGSLESTRSPDGTVPPQHAALAVAVTTSERPSSVASHTSLRSLSTLPEAPLATTSTLVTDGGTLTPQPTGPSSIDALSPDSARPQSKGSALSTTGISRLADLSQTTTTSEIDKTNPNPHLPNTNLSYLLHENAQLQAALNFERWHKSQYSHHITTIVRKNVRAATSEAHTLNLINQNQSLKAQLEQASQARDATIKDSALTRKQAHSLESDLLERFGKFKIELERGADDAEELKCLRGEVGAFRDLLIASEAREVQMKLQLDVAQREVREMEQLRAALGEAKRRLHEVRGPEGGEKRGDLEKDEKEKGLPANYLDDTASRRGDGET